MTVRSHLCRLILVFIAFVACGCATARSTLIPATAVPSDVDNCVIVHASVEYPQLTISHLASAPPQDAVLATVISRGVPIWDSATGQGPKPGEPVSEGREYFIHTPFNVRIDHTLAGKRVTGDMTVLVLGGQIGCSSFNMSPAVILEPGSRYVLMLKPRSASDSVAARSAVDLPGVSAPVAWLALPVQADGRVATPLDGLMSIDAVAQAFEKGAPGSKP